MKHLFERTSSNWVRYSEYEWKAAGISGASRIAGFGEGTPQQVSREGQNRRIADFGTVVETCSP